MLGCGVWWSGLTAFIAFDMSFLLRKVEDVTTIGKTHPATIRWGLPRTGRRRLLSLKRVRQKVLASAGGFWLDQVPLSLFHGLPLLWRSCHHFPCLSNLGTGTRLSGNLLSVRGNWAVDPETRRPNPDWVAVITGCAQSMPGHAVSSHAGAGRWIFWKPPVLANVCVPNFYCHPPWKMSPPPSPKTFDYYKGFHVLQGGGHELGSAHQKKSNNGHLLRW